MIVAHGGLAQEYLAAVEHLLGPQDQVQTIQIAAEDGLDAKYDEIRAAARAVDAGQGTVLVTDLYGSTPSNLACRACEDDNMDLVYGVNVPLLVQLFRSRGEGRRDAVQQAVRAGKRCIDTRPAVSVAAQ
ncbi:MAG: PTS fructose transporter subunit IIA [Pseudomonadota bacterium]